MATQRSLIIVEGPHDVEFVGRLLHLNGFERVQMQERLDTFWEPLIPNSFPHKGDLLKRVPVPTFFAAAGFSVAIHSAIGDSRIPLEIAGSLAQLGLTEAQLAGLGIVLDADAEALPGDRHRNLVRGIADANVPYQFPEAPGLVFPGVPRRGVFIVPNNADKGTLEDLLLECAAAVYPKLLDRASDLVQACREDDPLETECQRLVKVAQHKKAVVGCIANVLKPGRAIQNSIQDNRWVSPSTLGIPNVARLKSFLLEIVGLGGV